MTNAKQYCPGALIDVVEKTLSKSLHQLVYSDRIPRGLISFAREDGYFDYRVALMSDPTWRIFHADIDVGLMGFCLKADDIVFWPSNEHSKFSEGDKRTIFELAVPIRFKGHVVGVLLVDYFNGDTVPEEIELRADLTEWSTEVEDLLNGSENEKEKLTENIYQQADRCLIDTKSLRGYAAIKGWDGRIQYFRVGNRVDRFRQLSQLEGICGEAFRTGTVQNVGNVWEHSRYVPSDDRILSEVVAPIIHDGETIGVLNMESRNRDYYDQSKQSSVELYAKRIVPSAVKIREPADFEFRDHSRLLSDLVESLNSMPILDSYSPERTIEGAAFDILEHRVKRIARCNSIKFMLGEELNSFQKSKNKAGLSFFDSGRNYFVDRSKERWTSFFPFRMNASTYAILRVETEEELGESTIDILLQFCRITQNEIRRRINEAKSQSFQALILDCSTNKLENIVYEAINRICFILDCDSVTFFAKEPIEGDELLFPVSSTSKNLNFEGDEEFYRVDESDGLTGFAASQDAPLIIQNARDTIELRKISSKLQWKAKIGENGRQGIRSFFALPIKTDDGLVGVLRGHRSVARRNIPFSQTDVERLNAIKFILECSAQGASS